MCKVYENMAQPFGNNSAFRLPCYGICPFQVACGEGCQVPVALAWQRPERSADQILSRLNLRVLTDFAVNAKSWAELLRLLVSLLRAWNSSVCCNLKKTKSKIYLTYSMLYDTIRPERKGGEVNGKEHSHQGGAG